MLKIYITLAVLLLICMQSMKKRLLTSATVWAGCYYCYFVIAPLLLNDNSEMSDKMALTGIFGFLAGYVIVYVLTLRKNKRRIYIGCYRKTNTSIKSYEAICDYVLVIIMISFFLTLGKDGLMSFANGNLAAKDYLIERNNVFAKVYSFLINIYGYMLLYLFIRKKGMIDRKIVKSVFIYALIMFFFSFTRAPLLLLLAALFLYALRKTRIMKQIVIMGGVVIFGVVLMIVMGYMRIYGQNGLENLSFERLINDLAGSIDFTIPYTDFKRLIQYDVHISPLVYLKPLFMIIPRTIWKNKPYASTVQILSYIDSGAMARGYSTGFTILGEGYAVFGDIGIVVIPLLWGILCAVLDEMYIRKIKKGTDYDYFTCGYMIFTAYTVVQCHRQGTDAVVVYWIIAMLWLWLCSKIKVVRVKSGIKFKALRIKKG